MSKKDDGTFSSWQERNDGGAQDHVGGSKTDALSPFDDEIDTFFGNINDLTDRFSRMTKKIVGHTYDQHQILPWLFESRDEDEDQAHGVDYYFNRPYQSRSTDIEPPVFSRSPLNLFNLFSEPSGVTPYGMFAYQGPTPKEFNTCMKKEGVSLWDADGYWRCLFPNSKIPANFLEYRKKQLADEIVTKEDFEEQALLAPPNKDGAINLGPKGVFFRQFNDLLNWKNTKYENEKKILDQQQQEMRQNYQYNYSSFTKGSDINNEGEKTLVGTSSKSTTNTESSGEIVSKETKTEYFSDGTSVTNSIVRRKPQGASTWASVEEKSEHGNAKPGWFWNSK
ncbi:hypothetical protein METBIDRAFT_80774 [Metschnikowia bicuspidata var. bicuspidata NRRL YB-4993]|uniref:Mitochondrial peculiar membrane protein 1 n=1 Tax=Metschnikowia bicuspidata var. bicuspidata NRRL YB-4993 TaxID=869754 RepID=A0A1A0HH42_9ASCO|nr:hypothetical protein METBIDRAFT_80774 [Metschnikowia bicuspidata var. bicuspidata NRRL YB-4993]OBA23315.1 hypothetical protein METBIDRAFT_80774 [Metschnikowia bicuspidata var. bicuspidata NRRL YB-4993]